MKRRLLLVPVILLQLALAIAATSDRAPITAVDAVGMTVSDLDRSVAFYREALSFERVSEMEVSGSDYEHLHGMFGLRVRIARLRLGDEHIELTEFLTPRGRPVPVDAKSNDRWFQHVAIIVSDMDRAYQVLRRHRVEHVSPSPQRLPDWNPAAGGIRAFYFKDPDGHALEILQFPPDKGDPKWHRPTDQLFLGIDHTAVVVGDTEKSLAFYRDRLGLEVAGHSENYGPEQERLNNVFGARIRITALEAPEGPGIEFLEYLTPKDGRPAGSDLRANDVASWRTLLVTTGAESLAGDLFAGKYGFVSPGVVALETPWWIYQRGFLVRDPDGHVMQIMQR